MPVLSRATILLATFLLQNHFTHARPWPLLSNLGDEIDKTCVNGAKLPALWSINALVIDFPAGKPEKASFTLGNTQTKVVEVITCLFEPETAKYACKGPGKRDVKVTFDLEEKNGWSAWIGVSEPWGCGQRKARVAGEVEVGVVCPTHPVMLEQDVVTCISKTGGSTVDGVWSVDGPTDLRRRKGSSKPMYPVRKPKVQGVRDPWLKMAEKGKKMAEAIVSGGQQHGKGKAKTKKMSPVLVDLGVDDVVETPVEEEVQNLKKEEETAQTEKEMIDALEQKLCTPSCLREARPAPESGVQWTNGKINLQVELKKRRPKPLGTRKPMIW